MQRTFELMLIHILQSQWAVFFASFLLIYLPTVVLHCLFFPCFQVSIYSIWFYDKNDCHRIAKLMAK